jgi:hypothetical protein
LDKETGDTVEEGMMNEETVVDENVVNVNMVNVNNVVDEDYVVNKSNVHVNNADEKPEKRDVVDDINPEGKYDDEKNVEKQL